MNAYQMDDYDVYAAHSLEEAISLYEEQTGEKADPAIVQQISEEELDQEFPEIDENERETGRMTTLRRYLNELTAPGFLATSNI